MGHGKYIDPILAGMPPCPAGRDASAYVVSSGETLNLQYVVLPGESRNIRLCVDLTGPGAEVHIKALYLSTADEQVSFRILVHHRAPHCRSTQLIKGLAGGSARVDFDGTIVVAPDAQQTEAFQENHNILLSPTARIETRPQLEIYADDVKCSHGATVGQLSEEEQFYMRARGIPAEEARRLQILSFLSPVLSGLSAAEREAVEACL